MRKNFSLKRILSVLVVTVNCNLNMLGKFVYANNQIESDVNVNGADKNRNVKKKYYFKDNASNYIKLSMEKIWEDAMELSINIGIQINKFDDRFLGVLKREFIENAYLDFYSINKNRELMAQLTGSYELIVSDVDIRKISELLSKILVSYSHLSNYNSKINNLSNYNSKINNKKNFTEIITEIIRDIIGCIKCIDTDLKELPLRTENFMRTNFYKRIFTDKYSILSSCPSNLNGNEQYELENLEESWKDRLNELKNIIEEEQVCDVI